MPAQQRYSEQKFRAFKLHLSGQSHSQILWSLKDQFRDPVSSRMLSYWIKEFKALQNKPDNPDVPFELHRISEYDLPWEASEYLSGMLYWCVAAQGIDREPTVREVEWWWKVHLIEKNFTYENVFMVANIYSSREQLALMNIPVNYSDINGFLTYKPWLDEERLKNYQKAIKAKELNQLTGIWTASLYISLFTAEQISQLDLRKEAQVKIQKMLAGEDNVT